MFRSPLFAIASLACAGLMAASGCHARNDDDRVQGMMFYRASPKPAPQSNTVSVGRHGHNSDYGRWGEYSGYGNRFAFYAHKDRYPGPPDPGVYPVEERLEPADEKFATQWVARIFYNPGGLVYSGWGDYMGHERTRRVGFRLATDDQNLLHYDELTVGELEAYINDPTEREQYLEMLPTLFAVRKHLVAERTHEATFAGQLALREKLPVGEVLEALRWWKDRVSIKRSLRDDDAKAWRMIIRKVRNKAWEGE